MDGDHDAPQDILKMRAQGALGMVLDEMKDRAALDVALDGDDDAPQDILQMRAQGALESVTAWGLPEGILPLRYP